MTDREIRACIAELTDSLYDRNGFANWWNDLDKEIEEEIENELFNIIKERLNKNK